MTNVAYVVLLLTSYTISTPLVAQECGSLRSGSIAAAVDYIDHASDGPDVASCVQFAFEQIATNPPVEAIPILVKYLGYKRPLNDAEQRGIFMHGKGPSVLYPAVHELGKIGSDAEPALVAFIANGTGKNSPEVENSLYAMLLIHHGNVVPVIRNLRIGADKSTTSASRDRLEAAATRMMKWCDDRARAECEAALRRTE